MAAVALNVSKAALPRIHPTTEVSEFATLGDRVHIWHQAQIREGATIGESSIVGKGVYIDSDVEIGANCKIQNCAASLKGIAVDPEGCGNRNEER